MFSDIKKPDFENLINTLFLKESRGIPLIELGIHPEIKKKIMGKEIITVSDEIEFMKQMGYDYIKLQPQINFQMDFSHTSHKNLVDRNWAPEKAGIIKTIDDFEKYPWPENNQINYSRLEEARKIIPENMGVIGQYGDLFTVAWELMGFENFALATFENPDLVKMIMDKIGNIMIKMFEDMTDMDWVGAIWFSDDIAYATGLMFSPDFFREYFFPYLKKIASFAKLRNIPFLYHTDGFLWDVLDDIVDCGVNGLHPIEPKAMKITEVREKYYDNLCVCGGIDVDTLARGTVEDVQNLTKKFITEMSPFGGWCAGSSNSIPDYVKTENYIEMVKAVLLVKN